MNAAKRKAEDKRAIALGRQWAQHLGAGPQTLAAAAPLAAGTGARLLALGDSWLRYFPPFDVLIALRNKYGYAVQTVAVAGTCLSQLAPPDGWNPAKPPAVMPEGQGQQLHDLLQLVQAMSAQEKAATKAILVSGGGNDVVGKTGDSEVLNGLLNAASPGRPALNGAAVTQFVDVQLRAVLAQVLAAVTQIAQLHFQRAVPIVIHGYGHPVPDGRAPFQPWLRTVIQKKGYTDLQAGTDIMEKLIDRLNAMQIDLLQQNPVTFAHVHHADVRGALSNTLAGDDYKQSWQNELHPTIPAGFIAVADRLQAVLATLP